MRRAEWTAEEQCYSRLLPALAEIFRGMAFKHNRAKGFAIKICLDTLPVNDLRQGNLSISLDPRLRGDALKKIFSRKAAKIAKKDIFRTQICSDERRSVFFTDRNGESVKYSSPADNVWLMRHKLHDRWVGVFVA
mgnify:CR=1 FL=1